MKSWAMSEYARDRLQRLSEASSASEYLEILETFVALEDVEAAIGLVLLGEKKTQGLRAATMRVVDQLLGELPAVELPSFSKWVRRGVSLITHAWGRNWYGMSPPNLSAFEELEGDVPRFWGLLTMHPNGFVREASLRRLAEVHSGAEIPFLLLRAGDWVPEIQIYAVDLLRARLQLEYADDFADNLVLVMRLFDLGAPNVEVLGNDIVELLSSEGVGPILLNQIRTGRRRERRIAFSIALKSSNSVARAAINAAARSEDDVLRTKAVRAASEYLSRDETRALLVRHRRDPHRVVRRDVAWCFVDYFPDEAEPVLREMLFDSSATNRHFARFHLRRRGDWDFREIYEELLEAEELRLRLAGLCGLGDIGESTNVERIVSLIDDESPRLRRAAIDALSAIDACAHAEHFYTALDDEVRAVSRAAAKGLRGTRSRLSGRRLWSKYAVGYPGHVATNALFAARALSSWPRLEFLFRAVPHTEDSEERDRLFALLDTWCERSRRLFVTPSDDDAARIWRVFHATREILPEALRHRIGEILNRKLPPRA